MGETKTQTNSEKVLFTGILLILAVYGLLWLAQSFCIHILPTEGNVGHIGCLLMHIPKYSVPFPYGWCMALEWFAPFFLCLSYVVLTAGQKKIHILLTGIMTAGFLEVCFGRYGLKSYSQYGTPYWETADPNLGKFLPIYFIGWFFAALLLMFASSFSLKRFAGKKRVKTVLLFCIFLVSLSEGVLFGVVYSGQYIAFFAARSLLSLLLVLLSVWQSDRRDVGETVETKEGKQHSQKKISKVVKRCWIGMTICILFYVLVGIVDMLEPWTWERHIWRGSYSQRHILFSQYYVLLLAVAGTVYTVKTKKSYGDVGVLAVLCGIAFWVQRDIFAFTYYGIELATALGLEAKCIILYLLFTWLWRESRIGKMIFNVILYLIAIGGVGRNIRWLRGTHKIALFLLILLLVVMLGITLYTLLKTETPKVENGQGKKGLFLWVVLLFYMLTSVGDCEILIWFRNFGLWKPLGIADPYSVLNRIGPYIGVRNGGMYTMCTMAFFITVSYLAHALKSAEMQLFTGLGAFTVMYFVESNPYEDWLGKSYRWYVGLPISMLLIMVLLFFLPFLIKRFPKKENILGGLFLLVTYAMLFLNFVLPFIRLLSERADRAGQWGLYLMMQIVILGITVFTLILYGKKQWGKDKLSD